MALRMAARKPSKLTDEELSSMTAATEEVNLKLNAFLQEKQAREEDERRKRAEEVRAKIVERIETEKAEAREAKTYIPQRLEEIEREEALLESRVADFNAKVKDTDVKQL